MPNLFPDIAETPSGQSSLSSVPTVTEEYQVPFGVEPRSGPYRNFILFASGIGPLPRIIGEDILLFRSPQQLHSVDPIRRYDLFNRHTSRH